MTLLFGPLFPDASKSHVMFGPLFPDAALAPGVTPPYGPGGVGTFQIDLEHGAKITWSWLSDVVKVYSGKEYRAGVIDYPKTKFDGAACLVGTAGRQIRAQLAQGAADGLPFLLGLGYEELTVVTRSTNNRVFVNLTLNSDWTNVIGQRVVVFDPVGNYLSGSIQAFGSNFVDLDVDATGLAIPGSRLMPVVSVLLDATQGFSRYSDPNGLEVWQLRATAATFGFQSASAKASVSLSSSPGALHGMSIERIVDGSAGNAYTIQFVADSLTDPGSLTNVGTAYTFHFKTGVTTIGALIFGTGSVFGFRGTYDLSATFFVYDAIGPLSLSGGRDRNWGVMGRGATVNMVAGVPIWDRYIQIDGSAGDSIQAMTELIDFDGVPVNVGTADAPDWGRQIRIRRNSPNEFQWMKAFLSMVNGQRVAFWVPTWRADLQFAAVGVGGSYSLKIQGPSPATGDFFSWFPAQRRWVQIWKADGTFLYWLIDSAVDNLDGTITLLSHDPGLGTLNVLAQTPQMISWLELCHFNSDSFDVQFDGPTFTMETTARVVQQ